jgi:hypothetical protein
MKRSWHAIPAFLRTQPRGGMSPCPPGGAGARDVLANVATGQAWLPGDGVPEEVATFAGTRVAREPAVRGCVRQNAVAVFGGIVVSPASAPFSRSLFHASTSEEMKRSWHAIPAFLRTQPRGGMSPCPPGDAGARDVLANVATGQAWLLGERRFNRSHVLTNAATRRDVSVPPPGMLAQGTFLRTSLRDRRGYGRRRAPVIARRWIRGFSRPMVDFSPTPRLPAEGSRLERAALTTTPLCQNALDLSESVAWAQTWRAVSRKSVIP